MIPIRRPASTWLKVASDDESVLDYVESRSTLDTLTETLERTGLDDILADDGSTFNVFAPTDDASAGIDLDALSDEELTDVLERHVISGSALRSTDITDGLVLTAIDGTQITFGVDDDGVTVGNARVVTSDAEVYNGIVHEIDAVLD